MSSLRVTEVWYDSVTERVVLPFREETAGIKKRLAVVISGEVHLVEELPVASSDAARRIIALTSVWEDENRRFTGALNTYLDDLRKTGRLEPLKANHEGVATAVHPSWYDPEVSRPPAGVLMNLLTVGGREVEGYWREDGGFIAWSPKMKVPAWAKERMQKPFDFRK